ncbi:hypothetical protein [Halotalea alkalilenta]|nr:hypothetical protein [Halotalea alkalilenta]
MSKEIALTSLNTRPEFTDACAAWSYSEWGVHSPRTLLATL